MTPRITIDLASHVRLGHDSFVYRSSDHNIPIFHVHIINKRITLSAYTENDLFDLAITFANSNLYNIHIHGGSNRIRFMGAAEFHQVHLHDGTIEITEKSDLTFSLLQAYNANLITHSKLTGNYLETNGNKIDLHGDVNIDKEALILAGAVSITGSAVHIAVLTLCADSMCRIGERVRMKGQKYKIHAANCFVYGHIETDDCQFNIQRQLFLADTSYLYIKNDLVLRSSIVDYNGRILCYQNMDAFASTAHKFGPSSATSIFVSTKYTGKNIYLDGFHYYINFEIHVNASLDFALSTILLVSNTTMATLMGKNVHLRGETHGKVTVTGVVIVNEATSEGELHLNAIKAVVNTDLSHVDCEEFSIYTKRIFAEGKANIEKKCTFVSKKSTYLSDKLDLTAGRVKATGEGHAIIAANIDSKKSVKVQQNGVAVIDKRADITAGKKSMYAAESVSLGGKSDTKEIQVFTKTVANVTKEFTSTPKAKMTLHSEGAYRVAAKTNLAEIILIGDSGCVAKKAVLETSKAVFVEGRAVVEGVLESDKLQIVQEKGSFAVSETGKVKYCEELQVDSKSVYVAGKLNGRGDEPSRIKSTTFITESTSKLILDSPLHVKSSSTSLSGYSEHNNTVITSQKTRINGKTEKGHLLLAGEGDDASVAIGNRAKVGNDKLIVKKTKYLAISGNVPSKEIHLDVDQTLISPTGTLGSTDSNVIGLMNTIFQLGDIKGKSANLHINHYYFQNGLRGSARTDVHTLRITSPIYINLFGGRDTNYACVNTLLPSDTGIFQGNFIVMNSLIPYPLPLVIIPSLYRLYTELKRIWSEGLSGIDASYMQVTSQTMILFIRAINPVMASLASVGMNSYFVTSNLRQLSTHKILRGQTLTNAEWIDLLVIVKNIAMSLYAISSEAHNSYEAVNKSITDHIDDVDNYFRNHFLKDIEDIRSNAIHSVEQMYFYGKDKVTSLFRDHPTPTGNTYEILKDGKEYIMTPYDDKSIENAALDHPGDKVMLDTNGRFCLAHEKSTDTSTMVSWRQYFNDHLEELQDDLHIFRMDSEEYVNGLNETSLCHAFQYVMPVLSLILPSVYIDCPLNLGLFKLMLTGAAISRSIFDLSLFSASFALSVSKQAEWIYDFSKLFAVSANFRGHYVYLNESFNIPMISVSADQLEQNESASIDCYMKTLNIPNMKKYRITATVNNFIYETIVDEKDFLKLAGQWRDQQKSNKNFEVNYTTNHKLVLDDTFVSPWKVSYTATEIVIPTNVIRGSKEIFTLCSTKGSITSNGILVGKKVIEDSAVKIVEHGGGVYTDELIQHARNGIDQHHTEVIARTGYQVSDYNNIDNHASNVRFSRFGFVDAVRGAVNIHPTGSIRGGNGAPYGKVGLVVHGGSGIHNHAGAIGSDAQSIISGDDYMIGVANQHHQHIERPCFYSNKSSVILVSKYGTLDAACGHYAGKEGIYFDLRDAPHFRGLNVHHSHHSFKKLFNFIPVGNRVERTDEQVSQQFDTNGVLSFCVKYHDLVIPDSSIVAAKFVTDVWNGKCYFPQTPIYHHDTVVSLTFGGNVAYIHFEYDESGRIFCSPPVLASLKSVKNSSNALGKGLGLLNTIDELLGLRNNGFTPDIGVHAGIKVEDKHYQTPNHTRFYVGIWIDYSRGINLGDVHGSIGKLVMYKGKEFNVSGEYYSFDVKSHQIGVGLSYNPFIQKFGANVNANSTLQHGGYWHYSELLIGNATFHQPVVVTCDQAKVSFLSATGAMTERHINHADSCHTDSYGIIFSNNGICGISYQHANSARRTQSGFSIAGNKHGIESIGLDTVGSSYNLKQPNNLVSTCRQQGFFARKTDQDSQRTVAVKSKSPSTIYNLPNKGKRDCFDDIDTYRAYLSDEHTHSHHHGMHPHLPILKEWMHLAKYLTSIDHPFFKKPLIVYRGDAREPNVVLNEGLHAKGKNPSILHHMNYGGNNAPLDSLYISTSLDSRYAGYFPRAGVQDGFSASYVYKISAPDSAMDVQAEVAKLKLSDSEKLIYAAMRHEMEVVIPKQVAPDNILGYYKLTRYCHKGNILDISISEYIPNPALNTKWYDGLITGDRVMKAGGVLGWGMAIGVESVQLYAAILDANETGSIDPIGTHLSSVVVGFPAASYFGSSAVMYTVAAAEAAGAGAVATVALPVIAGTVVSTAVYCALNPAGELAYKLRFAPRETFEEIKQTGFRFFDAVARNQPYTNPRMYSPNGFSK